MKNYAQDPIDYIRDFRFTFFQSNPGSSKGPTCKEQDLVIRLTDVTGNGATELLIPNARRRVAKYIAAWLEKQSFYVFPLAELVISESSTWINLQLAGTDINYASIKTQLDALIGHIGEVEQVMCSGERGRIISPRGQFETNPPTPGQLRTLGRQPADNRNPGYDNRTPQNWNAGSNTGGTGNNNDW